MITLQQLQISKGIRFLKSINDLNPTYISGDRRDHFVPETSLRRIAEGFLRERIFPELRQGTERLARAKNYLREDDHLTFDRIQSIKTWTIKANRLLPIVSKFLGERNSHKLNSHNWL